MIDATKIEGFYDFSVPLETSSDDPIEIKKAIGMATRDGSLARTIAETAGLRLEARKGPVEIIVVDRAERSPSDN